MCVRDSGTARILGQETARTVVGDLPVTPCFCAPGLLDGSGGLAEPLAGPLSLAATGYPMRSGVSPFTSEIIAQPPIKSTSGNRGP